MAKFLVYKDNDGKLRWRLKARNGRIVADSGEGYNSKRNLMDSIRLLKVAVKDAEVVDAKLSDLTG